AAHPNVPPAFSRRENHLYVLTSLATGMRYRAWKVHPSASKSLRLADALIASGNFSGIARASDGRVGEGPRALLEETPRRIWTTVLPWCAPAASPPIDRLRLHLWA